MQRNCNAVRKPSFPPCEIAPQTPTYPVPLSAGYKIVKLASGVHSVHSLAERNGMMSLAYTELVPVTIRAIQELNQKLELDLAAQHKASDAQIQNLEKENEDLRLPLEKTA